VGGRGLLGAPLDDGPEINLGLNILLDASIIMYYIVL
jgi:hypothetical protein